MDNYNLIINNDDLLGLLFNKVPYIWQALDYSLKSDPAYQRPCLYKESVQVIRALEKFVGDLKSGSLPRAVHLDIDVTMHAELDHSFLVYFNALRFEREMFDMANLWLGINWTYYQKFLKDDAVDLPSITPGTERILSNSEGSQEMKQQWSLSKFTNEKARRLSNFFLDVQKNSFYIEETEKQTQQVIDNINYAFNDFDTLLAIHQKVYILALDVRFVRTVNPVKNEPLERLIEQVLKDRADIQNAICNSIPYWLRAYTKLEHDFQNGLKLSCILILRRHGIEQEAVIIARLQELLKRDFSQYNAIDVINGNEFVRTHAKKNAVGPVGVSSSKGIEQFKYWVLSYFFKIASFARLINPKMPFDVSEVLYHPDWQLPEIKRQAVVSKKGPPPKNLVQILQAWKPPKGIWDINHLDKRVADRLLVGQIYYKEFCAEQGLPIQYGELLFLIEMFIETLLPNQHPAFNRVGLIQQSYFLNAREIQTTATQLGHQYLSLLIQIKSDLNFWDKLDFLIRNRGFRPWWFRSLDDLILWENFQSIILEGLNFNQPVDSVVLGRLNSNLQNIRSLFLSKQISEGDKRKLLEKHYTQCIRRHANTREYLNRILEQNCWAYRIIVDARSSKGNFTQPEFSKLFTEFMRLSKRAKPCCWLRGYIGGWQENSFNLISEFKLDIVLFFNDRCQEQFQTVVHDLNRRWNNFLDTKTSQILKLQDVENITFHGAIKSRVLMHSADGLNAVYNAQNSYHVYLEAYDKKMKKEFIEQVVTYFAYRDVFHPPFSHSVPKAFIKGAMPKK
jgi:hypothetical protein